MHGNNKGLWRRKRVLTGELVYYYLNVDHGKLKTHLKNAKATT